MPRIYTNAALACVLAANDMHHIHFYAEGKHFDRIHDMSNEYYEKLSEEADYLCELALEKEEIIPNLTNTLTEYGDWFVQDLNSYDYSIGISSMIQVLTQYVSALDALRQVTDDTSVQSKLDDMIRDWSKEINYKLAKRSDDTSVTSDTSPELAINSDQLEGE